MAQIRFAACSAPGRDEAGEPGAWALDGHTGAARNRSRRNTWIGLSNSNTTFPGLLEGGASDHASHLKPMMVMPRAMVMVPRPMMMMMVHAGAMAVVESRPMVVVLDGLSTEATPNEGREWKRRSGSHRGHPKNCQRTHHGNHVTRILEHAKLPLVGCLHHDGG